MSRYSQITVVLTCKNKEKDIKLTADKIIEMLKKLINEDIIDETSHLLLIDNNSKDNSWYEIGKTVARNPFIVQAKKLAKNTKTSAILKNNKNSIALNFKNYIHLKENLNKINTSLDKFDFIKDIFKSSKYEIIDELK
ncbi:MAG: hypothetical protein IJ877_06940 [Candidatus Gastranaerophilales bacterium]|nr:hypothetical protein [Candidatus Gastranaerophilales bacterium]